MLYVSLKLNDVQIKFLNDSVRRINSSRATDAPRVSEADVIHHLMEFGFADFIKYLDALPKKTVKHLKVMK